MARGTTTFAAALALLAAGCTCAIDPDQYLGARDAAVPDGALPDGDLPDGDLPDGDLPDGAVPDGGGDAGSLENLPPVVSGVGLSDFRPVPGDTLSVTIGPFLDPNGDPVTRSIEWTVNGAPAGTGLTFTLDSAMVSPGDEITVEVTFDDGTLSTTIDAGPATVLPDETRWNLLMPPRGTRMEANATVFDPVRQRLLWRAAEGTVDHGLWEYQLSDLDTPRWVRLEGIRGIPPDAFQNSIIADPNRDRILFAFGLQPGVVGGADTTVNNVWALDTSGPQGSEAWSEITGSGDVPSARSTVAHVPISFDDGTEAIFFYGGLGDDMGFSSARNDAFFLRVEASDRWEQITASALPSTLVIPTTFFDPDTGVVYLAGGAVMSGSTVTGTTAVYAFDVDAPGDGFTPAGFGLPDALLGGAAIVEDGFAYIFGGARSVGDSGTVTPNEDIYRIDLATMVATTLSAVDGPGDTFLTVGSRAPFTTTHVVSSRSFRGRSLRFFELEAAGALWSPITGQDIDVPPTLMQGVGADRLGSGAAFYGGLADPEDLVGNGTVWLWTAAARWEERDLTRDPIAGVPGPRWGFVMDTTEPSSGQNFFVIGGLSDGGVAADERVWEGGDSHWTLHRFLGASAPSRVGHVLFRGYCAGGGRGNLVGFHGGRDPVSGAGQPDTWMADCIVATGDDCRWFDPVSAGAGGGPGVRVWSAATQLSVVGDDPRHTFLFGGLGGGGATQDAYYFDACSASGFPGPWTPVTVSGDAPNPVMGHSLTATIDADRNQSRSYLLFGADDEAGAGARNTVHRMTWNGDVSNPALDFTSVTPAGDTPTPRIFHLATYDRDEDRILVYGGLGARGEITDDLWELVLRE